jgi:hypothetical protein
MSKHAAAGGVDNPDVALDHLTESLTQRFPDVDRHRIDRQVHETYASLAEQATVDSHLVAMTEGQVTDDLRQHGETVHVRTEGSDSADEAG